MSSWCILKILSAAFCYSLSFWHVRDDGRDTHTQKKGEANASPRNVRVFCRITSVEKACTHGDMVLNCFSLRESNSEVVGHKNQNKDPKDPKMPHGADSNSVRWILCGKMYQLIILVIYKIKLETFHGSIQLLTCEYLMLPCAKRDSKWNIFEFCWTSQLDFKTGIFWHSQTK